MPISGVKVGIAVGVGILDEIMEEWDIKERRYEPFRRATDFARLGLAGIGYLTQIFAGPKYGGIGEGLALAATPLLVKSIAKPVKGALVKGEFIPKRLQPSYPPPPAPAPSARTEYIEL